MPSGLGSRSFPVDRLAGWLAGWQTKTLLLSSKQNEKKVASSTNIRIGKSEA